MLSGFRLLGRYVWQGNQYFRTGGGVRERRRKSNLTVGPALNGTQAGTLLLSGQYLLWGSDSEVVGHLDQLGQ